MTSDRTRSEPSTIKAATIGNAADDGSAGTTTSSAVQFGLAGQRDLAAMAAFPRRDDLGAEMLQHQFGVVAARLGFDHGGDARRGQSRQQHRRFDLRRGHRRAVEDRQRIARAMSVSGSRPPSPLALTRAPINSSGIQHPPHRPAAQRGIAVERRRDRAAGDRSHHQPAAGAGIAEIERRLRLGKPGDPDAMHRPGEIAGSFDLRAQRPHRLGGIENVLALEQARNPGCDRPPARPKSGRGAKSTCRREHGPSRSGHRSSGLQAVGRLVGMGQDCVLCAGGRYHMGAARVTPAVSSPAKRY